ncbi:MAG TPA: hypothetical protein VKD72_26430, partial [Gemmataceae bacterium]|nr:hypothetical protein [Gemmataceae bacterium]
GVTGAGGVRGAGAYTLDIDVLPQLVSVESQPLLPGQGQNPGGPTASLVLTFQGDRLDPATAEHPANYRVTWLGPDGIAGTADDQVIPIQGGTGNKSVVYDPSTNVSVASGNVYPTAIRQTVTLLFTDPLPAGSYQIELSPAIQTAAFNEDELGLIAGSTSLTGHPVVSRSGSQLGGVTEGARVTAQNLVFAAGALGDFGIFQTGTPFLTQLHDDLGALLDAELSRLGDNPLIPGTIDDQIQDRFDPALGPVGQRPVAVLVIWLDPVSPVLIDSRGSRVVYDQQVSSFLNTFSKAYVNVTGNLEVIVLPFVATVTETFRLTVADVPSTVRGGALYFGADRNEARPLTADLRGGTTEFVLTYGSTLLSLTASLSASTLKGSPPDAGKQAGTAVPPAVNLPAATAPDSGKQGVPFSQGDSESTSSTRAAFTLVGTRTNSAPVAALGPVFQVSPSSGSSGTGAATTLASLRTASHEAGNSSALAEGSSGSSGAPGQQIPELLAKAKRALVELAGRMGGWLKAFVAQLQAEVTRPAPERTRTEEMPMQPPPEEESEPSQETPEASGALFEEGSPEAEASPACFVSVVGFGAYVVGLRAGEPNQRRRHRGAPETL